MLMNRSCDACLAEILVVRVWQHIRVEYMVTAPGARCNLFATRRQPQSVDVFGSETATLGWMVTGCATSREPLKRPSLSADGVWSCGFVWAVSKGTAAQRTSCCTLLVLAMVTSHLWDRRGCRYRSELSSRGPVARSRTQSACRAPAVGAEDGD